MKMRSFLVGLFMSPAFMLTAQDQAADSLIHAVGKVTNAETGEPVSARIIYESLPYGNRIGVITSSTYSFPMFEREHYSIVVEAEGFAPAKYLLDPASANDDNLVVRDIQLSTGSKTPPVAGRVLRLDNLIFEVGKARIDPGSYSELDLLLSLMRENSAMIIQLEGHTDYIGDARANLRLSQQRVDAVRNYLAGKGVSRNRMKTKAFGGSQPLSRDNTPEAHRLNRRVEVRILSN